MPTEARGGAEVEPKTERDCGDVKKKDGGADRGVARASLRAGGDRRELRSPGSASRARPSGRADPHEFCQGNNKRIYMQFIGCGAHSFGYSAFSQYPS